MEFDADASSAIETYGPIADWNVAAVTDMESLFGAVMPIPYTGRQPLTRFNADISSWQTSGVTNMKYMFDVRTHSGSKSCVLGVDTTLALLSRPLWPNSNPPPPSENRSERLRSTSQ